MSREGGATRASILRVAAALFRQRGFRATSMQDIADLVGITKSGLYHHFAGKQELLYEILQHTVDTVMPQVAAIAESDVPAADRLRGAVFYHIVQLVAEQDNVSCFIEEGRSLAPQRMAAFIAKRDRYEQYFRTIIADGVTCGEFRPVDVRLAGLAIMGMCNWVARWYRPDGDLGPEEIARQFGDLAVGSLLVGAGGVSSAGRRRAAPLPSDRAAAAPHAPRGRSASAGRP